MVSLLFSWLAVVALPLPLMQHVSLALLPLVAPPFHLLLDAVLVLHLLLATKPLLYLVMVEVMAPASAGRITLAPSAAGLGAATHLLLAAVLGLCLLLVVEPLLRLLLAVELSLLLLLLLVVDPCSTSCCSWYRRSASCWSLHLVQVNMLQHMHNVNHRSLPRCSEGTV